VNKIKPVKIAMLGEIRAGKDTVAQLITQKLDKLDASKPTQLMAFSTGIHEVIEKYFPEAYEQGKPRKHLQYIGQHFRALNPDVWVNYLFSSLPYQIALSHNFNIIVTDARQLNEVQRLMAEGFKVIKVVASPEVRLQRAKDAGDNFSLEDLQHETELAIHECPYDYLIDNSFSIDVLEQRVDEILEEVVEFVQQAEQSN
jgi:dephospho-CoA kinase